MYLKNLALDAPKIPERHAFDLQTRCVTALYERGLGKYKSNGFWKILVELVQEEPRPGIQNLLGVLLVQIRQDDLLSFFSKSIFERKRVALEFLQEGVVKACSIKEWDTGPFVNAYNYVQEHKYVNEWTWKKKKFNPSRKLVASVECVHDVDKFQIYLVVRAKSGSLVKREPIVEEIPSEFCFARYFGSLDWESENEVVFSGKYGKTRFALKI